MTNIIHIQPATPKDPAEAAFLIFNQSDKQPADYRRLADALEVVGGYEKQVTAYRNIAEAVESMKNETVY